MEENLSKVEIIPSNIEGELIEVTTTQTVRLIAKQDLLAEKLDQLAAHNEGVAAYLEAANAIKTDLENVIKTLENE